MTTSVIGIQVRRGINLNVDPKILMRNLVVPLGYTVTFTGPATFWGPADSIAFHNKLSIPWGKTWYQDSIDALCSLPGDICLLLVSTIFLFLSTSDLYTCFNSLFLFQRSTDPTR